MKRTNRIVKAAQQNLKAYQVSSVPKEYVLVLKGKSVKVPLASVKFKSKEEYLNDSTNIPFVQISLDHVQWLQKFANSIILRSTDCIPNSPFYNGKLDFTRPGMCAFRINDNDGSDDFLQVQVNHFEKHPELFQLSCFDHNSGSIERILTGICDITDIREPRFEVVKQFSKTTPRATMEFVQKITTLFQDLLIYLRPLDYECSSRDCEVLPWPDF